jgi:uncharacterized protein YebE (UPF0316 family)
MSWLDGLAVWQLAVVIFCLRIVDVSMGTLRTISVVQGRTWVSVGLGFCEVLVWITVMNQVIHKAAEHPLLLLAYAGGFASGNAVGIALERWLAMGGVILRLASTHAGEHLAELLRERSSQVFTFEGRSEFHPLTMIYVVVRRREVRQLVELGRRLDPNLFYSVESLRESSAPLLPSRREVRMDARIEAGAVPNPQPASLRFSESTATIRSGIAGMSERTAA